MSEEFAYIRDLLRERAGIYLDDDKEYLAESRITAIAQEEGFKNYREFIGHLRWRNPNSRLLRRVIESLMTNETFFFRDMFVFDTLRDHILPEIIKNRRNNKTLKIMSNACSTGQESYSLAMLINRHFRQLDDWDVMIMGTDYSEGNLSKAKKGRYSKGEILRGLPEDFRSQYFQEVGNEFELSSAIREKVNFRELNLKDSWLNFPRMDIIFLRNVLIYFDSTSREEILAKARNLLQPDGYLILGSSETLIGLETPFKNNRIGRLECYRLT